MKPFNIKKLSVLLSFFLCLKSSICAQYTLKPKADIGLGLGSGLGLTSALYLQQKSPGLTAQQIQTLNVNQVNAFDRFACYQWHPQAAKVSDAIAFGTACLYAYFLVDHSTQKDAVKITAVGLQSVLMTHALSNIFKLSLRPRPYNYNAQVDLHTKMKPDARMSFFSAHTGTVSALSFSFAYAYQTYHPNQKNISLWAASATLPAIQGYLRVRAGKHFPTDVITGYIVGLGSAWLMHKMHTPN